MSLRRQTGHINYGRERVMVPPYYISGFAMDGPTGTTWEANIGVGAAAVHETPGTTDNTGYGALTSAFTKKLDGAAWAAGSGANGLADSADAKAGANWYAAFLMRSTTGTDIGFDSSLTAANLKADSVVVAAGFYEFRLVSFVQVNDGNTDLRPFFYNPNTGLWQYREVEQIGSNTGDTTITLDIPEGDVDVLVRATVMGNSDESIVGFHHTSSTDTSQANGEDYRTWASCAIAGGTVNSGSGFGVVRADSSMQIHFDQGGDAPTESEQALVGFYVNRCDR
jgi:hypothetical protein